MTDALDLAYLAIVALAGAIAFWDAPIRLLWAIDRDAVIRSRRYHVVNLLSILLLAGWAGVLAAGLDAGLIPGVRLPTVVRLLGLAFGVAGATYGVWAKLAMGRAFAPTAAVPESDHVVDRGPFDHVRHPFYVGMWTALVGGCLVLDSLATAGLALALIPVIREIAILEEAHLADEIGAAYTSYASTVPRFIPGTAPGAVGRDRMG